MKWTLRYLRGTSKACLCYESNKLLLVGYTYADIADMFVITFACGTVS